MAKQVTDLGKQVSQDRLFSLGTPPTQIISASVDDSTTALSSSTTTLGSPTNLSAVAFDALPVRSGQTVTATFTFPVGSANFTHKRIVLHNIAFGSVTGTSATVMCGHDAQSIIKNSTVAITYTVALLLS